MRAAGIAFLLALLLAFISIPLWAMAFEARPPHGFSIAFPVFFTVIVLALLAVGASLRTRALQAERQSRRGEDSGAP